MSIFTNWGSHKSERKMHFSCDDMVKNINGCYFRAVDINAPANLVYRWLCQMRAAPYSYDKLDNRGKRSPRYRNMDYFPLEKNQKMMTIFNVESYIPGEEINLKMDKPPGKWAIWYVPTAITYKIFDQGVDKSRLVVKYVASWQKTIFGWFERLFIVFADFIMMRKQLLNFKALAERDYQKELFINSAYNIQNKLAFG